VQSCWAVWLPCRFAYVARYSPSHGASSRNTRVCERELPNKKEKEKHKTKVQNRAQKLTENTQATTNATRTSDTARAGQTRPTAQQRNV